METKGDYKKILVPFDGSKFSEKALETAVEISKKFGASLYLVTIIETSKVNPPGALLGSQKKMKKSLDEIKSAAKYEAEKMLSEKVTICKKGGIEANYTILGGVASELILKLIKKSGVDLVVMGSQGLTGFSKIKALGSVSRKISETASCSVMIIH